jgi:hypothetical protein
MRSERYQLGYRGQKDQLRKAPNRTYAGWLFTIGGGLSETDSFVVDWETGTLDTLATGWALAELLSLRYSWRSSGTSGVAGKAERSQWQLLSVWSEGSPSGGIEVQQQPWQGPWQQSQ